MSKKQTNTNRETVPITDSTEFDLEWNVNSVPELKSATIASKDGVVAFKRQVPIFKDNKPTDKTEMKPFFYVKVGDQIKATKLYASANRKFQQKWGAKVKDWEGKKIASKYAEAFGSEYLTWVPEGKLD